MELTDTEKLLCFHQTGRGKTQCEDVSYVVERDRFGFYGLADGQSGKLYCRIGGRAVLEAVAAFLEKKGVGQIIHSAFIDEVQYELARAIRDTLSALSKRYGADAADFASTVVAFATDPDTKEYVTVHLGDGVIIGVDKSRTSFMISPPENGITLQYTYLTASASSQHIRIGKGRASDLARLVLMTDGATAFARGRTISQRGKALLEGLGSHDEIKRCLQNSAPVDDASCIIVDF